MKLNKLLVVGGSGIEYHNGMICAKGAFIDYMEGLRMIFDHVTWLTTDYNGNSFKLPLSKEIHVVAKINEGYFSTTKFLNLEFLKLQTEHTHFLIFTPIATYLSPVILLKPLVKFRYTTYVGTNFRDHKVSKSYFKNLIWKKFFHLAIRKSQHAIVRGKFLRSITLPYQSNCSITIPLGNRPPDAFKLVKPESRFKSKTVIFIGVIKKSKGLQWLIESLEQLKIENVNLVVIGGGPDLASIQKLAAANKFVSTIFKGWMDDKHEISNLLNNSSFLVCPSLEPFEGVPRVIDEAIMHKLPVIATKMGGIDMEFQNGEIYKIDSNKSALPKALREMLTDWQVYQKYRNGLAGRHEWLTSNDNAAKQHAKIILHEKSS